MKIKNSEFISSAQVHDQNINPNNLPEIVVVGKSNVGKSSFINSFLNRKNLAYVGKTAGKTKLLNYFLINKQFFLIDVPGYGFAKLSKQQLLKFSQMMESYFENNQNLKLVIVLVDARHNPTSDDITMLDYLKLQNIDYLVIATKYDKLKNSEKIKNIKNISEKLEIEQVIKYSSLTKLNLELIYQLVAKYIGE